MPFFTQEKGMHDYNILFFPGCNSSSQEFRKFFELVDDLLRCWDEFITEYIPVSAHYEL